MVCSAFPVKKGKINEKKGKIITNSDKNSGRDQHGLERELKWRDPLKVIHSKTASMKMSNLS